MNKRPVQVTGEAYQRGKYMSLPRLITHWHQANSIAEVTPEGGKILEIGPGSGHTTWLLKNRGFNVTTLDFDASVKPDIIGDVTEIPCDDNTFDCVIAAEVLEHLPFSEFGKVLSELKRVSRGHVIVTLPAPFVGISTLINFPGIKPIGLFLGVPYWIKHKFDGQHYWELGKRNFGMAKILEAFEKQKLAIVKKFRPAPSLFCYFFVLKAHGAEH